ncbi:tetratricopeptide repeat protein [uncultured Zhongshania sp.]|uniref:tetratricopeptide repeat protein n=1 Tax=uncultured Zhongshania sp. TaxID=1642288 RepID=UPI0025F8A43E|nr:tetratricopeptide repeat protein [uncultured Zhongshania sp.]
MAKNKNKSKSGGAQVRSQASKRPSSDVSQVLPATAQTLFQQALHHHKQGQLNAAAQGYQKVLAEFPGHADSLHLLGLVAQSLHNPAQASALIEQAIKLSPKIAQYHFNHGVVLQGLSNDQAAIDAYRNAIRLKPDYQQAYENLGVALQDSGSDEAALKAYQQALEQNPHSVLALKNLGTLYFKSSHTALSLQCFEHALRLSPVDPELRLKRSGSLLRLGQWQKGWREYRWRFSEQSFLESNPPRSTGLPHAEKFNIAGRRVFVGSEQGLGDEVMFASCFSDLISSAASCVLECDPRLVPLWARSFPSAEVIAKGELDPHGLDSFISAGDLPMHFRQDDADFSGRAYLKPDSEKYAHWQGRLQELTGKLKVGICWRGGVEARAVKERSIDLKYWRPLLKHKDVSVVNLQYRCESEELKQLGEHIHTFADLDTYADIDGLAALMSNLDLVISVDNTTVHLAGALGVPVWVLLPCGPERRWTDDSDDSVWYQSARLFRKQGGAKDGWRDVMARLVAALDEFTPPQRDERDLIRVEREAKADVLVSDGAKTCVLVNDTSNWYHWGCSGTSLSIHRALRRNGYRVDGLPIAMTQNLPALPQSPDDFDSEEVYANFAEHNSRLLARLAKADVLVINGEGSLHGGGMVPVGLLYIAHIGKTRLRKTVQIINHSCYPQDGDLATDGPLNTLYQRVYQQLDYVAVREPVSFRLLQSLAIPCVQSFDCLPLFIETFAELRSKTVTDKPYILLTGSVAWAEAIAEPLSHFLQLQIANGYGIKILIGASAFLAADDVAFAQWMQRSAAGQFELHIADTERQWLECIANAELLVSGRFHHSIAAACLDTPFIVTESNTPKVLGLLELLGMSNALLKTDQDFVTNLHAMAEQRLRDPASYVLAAERRAMLLSLADNNFAELH